MELLTRNTKTDINAWSMSVMAAEPGFEPGMNESESLVLPLHHSARIKSQDAVRSAYNTRL